MKKTYLISVLIIAFFTLADPAAWGQAGCSTLAITGSTPATINNCGGTATLTATASGTGDAIYWYDADTGGNKVGEGPSFTTPALGSTTSYWASEVLLSTSGGGTLPPYCSPTYTLGCSFGVNINDFVLSDSNGNTIINHLGSGCAPSNYDDLTGNSVLTGVLVPGGNYTFNATHTAPIQIELGIWIDFNKNGSFSDPGEEIFISTPSVSSTSGSITIPSSSIGGNTVMRVVVTDPTLPTPCPSSVFFGEVHDYRVTIPYVLCESTRQQVDVTVLSSDKTVPSTTTPSTYTDTDNTANFGDSYSGVPGSSCGTTSNYLGGNEVVYYYVAGDSYSLNVAMSGLSAGESGVFVYDSCLDIGSSCIKGMTSKTTTDYDFDMVVQSGEDYFIVVSSSAATSTLGYTLTLTETPSSCLNLAITNTTGGTIPCLGKTTLTATASGIGNDIYWYDAATQGNLVGTGPTFTTPGISTTTSYWATEVIIIGTPTTIGATDPSIGSTSTSTIDIGTQRMYFDVTAQATLVSVDIYPTSAIGSTSGIEIRDNAGSTVAVVPYTTTVTGGSTPQTIPLNITLPPGADYEMGQEDNNSISLTRNTTGANYPYPLTDVQITGNSFDTDYYYFFYNWVVSTGVVVCESPRQEVIATIATGGDITVTTPLPYSDTNDTANYGDPYEGPPGTTGCATTENYLNGNDVVYHFTAANTELVDIEMSNLSDFYGGVFVYGSCGVIMSTCLAGAVAGPSDNHFKIDDFQVTAGEDYYIVVSSWLSSSIGYTLDIIPFDCANLPAPDGDAVQGFVTGDTVSTLYADPTKTGATLIWYAEASDIPANPIVGDPALVNGEDYCVTQLLNGCESPPLCITVNEIDCSGLAITSTSGDSTTCKGIFTLGATGSGNGDDIYWYNVATGGTPIAFGPQFTTPGLTATTSYWVSEVYANVTTHPGQGLVTGSGNNSGANLGEGLQFDAAQAFTIISVDIYNEYPSQQTADVQLWDSGGSSILQSKTVTMPAGNGNSGGPSTPTTVLLNFFVPQGTDYRLVLDNTTTSAPGSFLQNAGTYPYPLGPAGVVGQITSGINFKGSTTNVYYHFYNWTISTESIVCESPRQQVDAIIYQTGDVALDYTDLNPSYTVTANTSNFPDKFSGDPGTGCDGAGILDGDDVIYHYTADPNNDDILDIELTNISNPNTGMYVYASCGEVGLNCLAGGTNENVMDILIDDYYVTAGTEIFIVISSSAGATNYTLNINGIDCANIAPPNVSSNNLYFMPGDKLDALVSEVNFNLYGSLTWYDSDPTATPIPTPIDPLTTPIVDGHTYYVTQTILGCVSAPLAITPAEFQCGNMKIDTITPDFAICSPGGNVTLNAQGSGAGSEVYWYDAQTGGNVVNIGESFDANVSTTTSFWASEVFINDFQTSSGYGLPIWSYGTGVIPFPERGLTFTATKAFTLVSVDVYSTSSGGNLEVALTNDLGIKLNSVMVNLPSGTTSNPTLVTVTLDFPVLGPGNYKLLAYGMNLAMMYEFSSSPALPYPFAIGNSGQITQGVSGFNTNDVYYYYFYNWTIIESSVACESARTEVEVAINDQPTAAPTGTAMQKLCEGNTLADIVVVGTDIQWYSTPTGGSPLGMDMVLQDGDIYYASQTVGSCESGTRLEVTVFILPIAPLPNGAINQTYFAGEHISDLNVTGTNLTWYENSDKTQEITDPANFPLENYETYYVSQAPAGSCESELLEVTVHEVLGSIDPLFSGLTYHPNPMKHRLNISNTMPMESVSVYDLRGRKIMERKVNGNEISLDVSNLQSGAYFLKVNIDGKTGVFKLVKE